MAKFRVLKVYVDIVECDNIEDASDLFNYSEADLDFVLDVIELDDDGNEINN